MERPVLAASSAGVQEGSPPNDNYEINVNRIATVTVPTLGRGPHLLRLGFTGGFNFDHFTYGRD